MPEATPGLPAGTRHRVHDVLARAQALGFLGPGPVDDQIDHSLSLALILDRVAPTPGGPGMRRALDLGSGGGIPGLVLALALPAWRWMLLDGSVRRAQTLEEAVITLGIGDRVGVTASRAEEAGRGPLRGRFEVLVARGFGPAAVTAECGAPFLRVGGAAVVTDPPGGAPTRWPVDGLAGLGMVPEDSVAAPVAAQVLRLTAPCPDRYPRRTGIPAKRPLWVP